MSVPKIRFFNKIADIKASDWDACANPESGQYNPFLSHVFLHMLEKSSCVSDGSGWQPYHLTLTDESGVTGVMPLYLKAHSRGEYVFDDGWANALHQAGSSYYPKLLSSVPFTPVTGQRLLVHPKADQAATETQLLQSCAALCQKLHLSSAHIIFLPEEQWARAAKLGWLQRMGQQYHWLNKGYADFDEFLANLPSKKRKNLKRERREALVNDIDIEWVTGSHLTERHWDAFYQFYADTGARKWGSPYLNRPFFSLLGEAMAEQILLVLCRRDGRYIAGALHFIGGDVLYGRYWGCIENHRFLHFEACYYQAIDFAIAHQLKRVEAGAQGEHKFIRGYVPCFTFSSHWIADPAFRHAVDNFLDSERGYILQDMQSLEQHTPYKKT